MDAGYDTYSRPRELTTPRVNPNVNSALGVMMLCQCRFIRWNKCTALMGDVDHGEGYALQEMVKDREAWHAAVQGVHKKLGTT